MLVEDRTHLHELFGFLLKGDKGQVTRFCRADDTWEDEVPVGMVIYFKHEKNDCHSMWRCTVMHMAEKLQYEELEACFVIMHPSDYDSLYKFCNDRKAWIKPEHLGVGHG